MSLHAAFPSEHNIKLSPLLRNSKKSQAGFLLGFPKRPLPAEIKKEALAQRNFSEKLLNRKGDQSGNYTISYYYDSYQQLDNKNTELTFFVGITAQPPVCAGARNKQKVIKPLLYFPSS